MDAGGRALITDFSLATVIQNLDSIWSEPDYQGHIYVRWTAPEILNEQGGYSKGADVFSFAMVTIEVHRGLVIRVWLWLTAISWHHRRSPARFLSMIAKLKWLCWQ